MQRELNIRACYTIELSALFFGLATSQLATLTILIRVALIICYQILLLIHKLVTLIVRVMSCFMNAF